MKDKNILVVEDEKPLADAIRSKLESGGFSVAVARTGEQALSYLEELSVDAVWLDHYLLGKASGLDLIVKIKAKESKWAHIPVFVVSNTASEEHVQTYLRLGAEKYYVKAEHGLSDIIEEIHQYIKEGEV